MKEQHEQHPSYGNIQLGRRNSNPPKTLFGSAAKHNGYIVISISTAELHRRHHEFTTYPKKRIIEVEMSEAQFAQFITSGSVGAGTPCTLSWTAESGSIPNCPEQGMRERFDSEVKESLAGLKKKVDYLKSLTNELLDKKSLTKDDKKQLLGAIASLDTAISSDIPFIQEMFDETMDNAFNQAVLEAEAHATALIQRIGLDAIANASSLPKIEG